MIHSNGLLFILTLRCEAASELASRELEEPQTRLDRAALWCHLLACRSCRRFRKQIRVIREAVRRNRRFPAEADANVGLSPERSPPHRPARSARQAVSRPRQESAPDSRNRVVPNPSRRNLGASADGGAAHGQPDGLEVIRAVGDCARRGAAGMMRARPEEAYLSQSLEER